MERVGQYIEGAVVARLPEKGRSGLLEGGSKKKGTSFVGDGDSESVSGVDIKDGFISTEGILTLSNNDVSCC